MSLLIYSGLLYLIGISIILILKPELMFNKDGSWKEFGLGRNKNKYTWMPFWLFAIMWAIISYILVLVIASNTGLGGVSNVTDIPVNNNYIEPENVSTKAMSTPNNVLNNINKYKPKTADDMKPGYYILDTNETIKKGIPKYIFLGPEAPNLIYHNTDNISATNDILTNSKSE
jgi:hypothetical protein